MNKTNYNSDDNEFYALDDEQTNDKGRYVEIRIQMKGIHVGCMLSLLNV